MTNSNEEPPKPPEPPLQRFDSKIEINLKVKSFLKKLDTILKEEFGDYASNNSVVFNLNLIWDLEIKDKDGYIPSMYAINTRPHLPDGVEKIVDILLSKDPLFVSAFTKFFSRVFFDMYMLSMTADQTVQNMANMRAESEKEEAADAAIDAENEKTNTKETAYLKLVKPKTKPEDIN